jgi:hypothetical protein
MRGWIMNTTISLRKKKRLSPARKRFKNLYLRIMLWVVGRAIQVGARIDRDIRNEFDALPEDFAFSLGVYPDGPCMVMAKDEIGAVRYLGSKRNGRQIPLRISMRNLEAAMLVFTFRESTAMAFARNRFFVDGGIPAALAVVRVLNRIETYLLPGFVARLAVKRYPSWTELPTGKRLLGRAALYLGLITG